MSGANGLLVIVIGLVLIWVIVANKGACLGGFFSCVASGSSGANNPLQVNWPAPVTGGVQLSGVPTGGTNIG